MYQVSNDVIKLIESRARTIEWEGIITLTDGTVISFTRRNISEGTGAINLSCAPNNAVTWGNAYLGELGLSFKYLDADKSKLQDAIISLSFRVTGSSRLTWGEATSNTWEELSAYTWGGLVLSKSIPMGLFQVEEAMRDYGRVKITAYDFMHRFDKNIPALDTTARTPYQWLDLACTTCGVTFGMSAAQIFGLPNGRRLVKCSNSDNSIKTWRDIVSSVAAMIGGNAVMSRAGDLVIRPYNNIIVDMIGADKRYSSSFSEYQSYYTGLWLSYKDGAVQNYVTNAASAAEDTGLAFDLKYNPFMQISDDTAREAMMQDLIDRQYGLKYTPFQLTGPLNPLYDLMDTLIFTENHAENAIAPVTNITYRIGGEMSLSCGGENPALMTAGSKEDKAIDGIASGNSYGENLWMLMGNAPSSQSVTVVADTETLVGEILLYAKEINSIIQIAYTATYNLPKTAKVTVRLAVDNETAYTIEQNQFIGVNKITATTGYQFRGTGSHAVRAYLKVSESTLDIGGGGILSTIDITENGLYSAAESGVYGFSKITAEVGDGLGYKSTTERLDYEVENANAEFENSLTYQAAADSFEHPDVSSLYCALSESAGDGAIFNGRYFTRTDDRYPLLFINLASVSGYNSYGVISNHEEIPPQTYNGHGDLNSLGTLQVDGMTFYVFAMSGWWTINRDNISYTLDGETVRFVGSLCYIWESRDHSLSITAVNGAIENDFKNVLARFALMG